MDDTAIRSSDAAVRASIDQSTLANMPSLRSAIDNHVGIGRTIRLGGGRAGRREDAPDVGGTSWFLFGEMSQDGVVIRSRGLGGGDGSTRWGGVVVTIKSGDGLQVSR